ncbi:MAG: hypothetical protein JG718_01105 [Candidatus Thiothrix moscowensis]|nr:hypothetical protein [Candidatus Thiothrix moscowensis]
MKKLIVGLSLLVLSATASAGDFFGGNNGEWKMGPYGPYYEESDWPEWTPMYWMDEMMNSFDDDDEDFMGGMPFMGNNNNFGGMPFMGNNNYPVMPYGAPGMAPMPYAQQPMMLPPGMAPMPPMGAPMLAPMPPMGAPMMAPPPAPVAPAVTPGPAAKTN